MFDMKLIRPALISNIQTLCDSYGLQPAAYPLGNPTPPTVQIMGVGHIRYDLASQRGGDENDVLVQAFVSLVSDQAGHAKLDELLASSGPTSMKEAIQLKDDPVTDQVTLGGLIDDLWVKECLGHQIFKDPMPGPGGMPLRYVGSTWVVQIETTG